MALTLVGGTIEFALWYGNTKYTGWIHGTNVALYEYGAYVDPVTEQIVGTEVETDTNGDPISDALYEDDWGNARYLLVRQGRYAMFFNEDGWIDYPGRRDVWVGQGQWDQVEVTGSGVAQYTDALDYIPVRGCVRAYYNGRYMQYGTGKNYTLSGTGSGLRRTVNILQFPSSGNPAYLPAGKKMVVNYLCYPGNTAGDWDT